MKNPLLNNSKNLYIYFFVWTVILSVHTGILYHFYHIKLLLALTDSLLFNILFADMAIGLWYSVKYFSMDDRDVLSAILRHLAAALVFLVLWLIAGFYLMTVLGGHNPNYLQFLNQSLPWRFSIGIFYYSVTVLIFYVYIYYVSFKEKLTREAELNTLIKETELSLLKSQLNPHFIFNSLNSISSLTISNPTMAQDMVIKLSSFLRSALDQSKSQMIEFTEELENSMLYLDIEKTRFGERMVFQMEISESCKNARLPNIILQPLLENAIKHGVYENLEPVLIRLIADIDNDFLHITITNSFDSETLVRTGNGIGIKNVKERLNLMFGRNDLVKIIKSDVLFEVNLYIPQNTNS